MQFIDKSSSAAVDLRGLAAEWEPAFSHFSGKLCPDLPDESFADRLIEFFKYRVRRNPRDLLAHVRRILLACAWRRHEEIESGLRELFVVLAGKGQRLRQHLLEAHAAKLLTAEKRVALEQVGKYAGTEEGSNLPIMVRIGGETNRIEQRQTTFKEALDYMVEGQVEQACAVLERALLAEPTHVAAARILFDILVRARDRERLVSLRERLEPMDQMVFALWEAAISRLEAQS